MNDQEGGMHPLGHAGRWISAVLLLGALLAGRARGATLGEDYGTPAAGNWVQAAKLVASDGEADDLFGWSVAVSGSRVVVGAPLDADNGSSSGSAHVFDWDGTQWIGTKLLPSDGVSGDEFGWSVAISGDRVVSGAFGSSKYAYVFDWDGTQWTETKLVQSDWSGADSFGISVAASGNRVVVGAPMDDNPNGIGSGSVYVYEYNGTAWVETRLIPSDGADFDEFGLSVAASGNRMAVGAYRDDDNGTDSGSAYVFEWDDGQWVETKLLPSDGAALDWYGFSVAADGDRVAVGSPLDDDGGIDKGSAYVFEWDGSRWVETKLQRGDGARGDGFGRSVAVSGNEVVVGALWDDDNGIDSGSVYAFGWDGSQWIETKLLASDGAAVDQFGNQVSVSGGRLVVGAPFDDDHGGEHRYLAGSRQAHGF